MAFNASYSRGSTGSIRTFFMILLEAEASRSRSQKARSLTFGNFYYIPLSCSCSFSLFACLFSPPHPRGSVFFLSTQLTREICKSKWRLCRVCVFLKLKEIFFSLSKNVQTEACSTVLSGKIYLNWLCICPTFFELQGRVDAGYIVGKSQPRTISKL